MTKIIKVAIAITIMAIVLLVPVAAGNRCNCANAYSEADIQALCDYLLQQEVSYRADYDICKDGKISLLDLSYMESMRLGRLCICGN